MSAWQGRRPPPPGRVRAARRGTPAVDFEIDHDVGGFATRRSDGRVGALLVDHHDPLCVCRHERREHGIPLGWTCHLAIFGVVPGHMAGVLDEGGE